MSDSNGHERPYLTVAELAKELSVSTRTVQRWIADTDIPYGRVGDIIRFRLDEVHEWMRRRAGAQTEAMVAATAMGDVVERQARARAAKGDPGEAA